MQSIETVEQQLKAILLGVLKNEVNPESIDSGTALVKKGLSLDSVTLLEFVLRIENEFQIMLEDDTLTIDHFESLRSLAEAVKAEAERQAKN